MFLQRRLLFFIVIILLAACSKHSQIHAQSTSTEVGLPVYRTTQAVRTNATMYAWSAWGKWSPCSRTCGGGVAVQERQCLPRDPARLRRSRKRRKLVRSADHNRRARNVIHAPASDPDCPGLTRRYHECNTAPCPGPQRDSRAEQCAVYDRRPFRGRFYTWVPYVDGDAPCILNCRPRGQQFYASLALVADGTACTKPGFRAICVQGSCKILCTLSFLANGSYQKIIGKNADTYISQPSASRAIHEVVNALNNINIIRKYIRFPQSHNERQVLKSRFYEKFKIPGVLGCIDGTLVSMIRPKKNEERYYCRKGYHARNVLIINDADLNILHVDVTFGGATHDSFVFSNTSVKLHLENLSSSGEIVYLLGDSGYPQRSYLMTPFSNPEAGTPESHYNNLHSSARNSVERTIGILKGRFRCLLVHRVLQYDPIMVGKIVIACCILHNMCNRAGLPAPNLDECDIEEESRLLGTLNQQAITHHNLQSGETSRRDLVNRLWRARHV